MAAAAGTGVAQVAPLAELRENVKISRM